MFFKRFHRSEREEILPSSFYRTQITLEPILAQATSKKENFRSIYWMDVHAKILNKRLANWIQQHIKKIIHNDQIGFSLGM